MTTLCPVEIRGTVYPSQKSAAAHLGVKPNAISQSLARHGHCNRLLSNVGRIGNTNAIAKPVKIGPLQFRSKKSAAINLGVSRTTLCRFLDGTAGQPGREIIMAAAMRYSRFGPNTKGEDI